MTKHLQRCKPLLGTFVDVTLAAFDDSISDNDLLNCSNHVFSEIERVQHALSFHDEESELTQLNKMLLAHDSGSTALSDDLAQVIAFAIRLFDHSNGYYDISIASTLVNNKQLPDHLCLNTQIKDEQRRGNSENLTLNGNTLVWSKSLCVDLGGIAKGYAVDCALKKIPDNVHCVINAGGDMASNHWQNEKVGLRYAKRRNAVKPYSMKNAALATSGNYNREKHSGFIDPKTQKGIKLSGSVSVFSVSAMQADALTKAVIVMPKDKVSKLLKAFKAQAIKINRWGFAKEI